MSGMEIVGIGASLAAAGVSAYAKTKQAAAQATAQKYQAQQLEIQSEYDRIAAMQEESARRNKLTSSLEAVRAVQAGRGVGMDSPTVTAIEESAIDRGERDIASSKLTAQAKVSQEQTNAKLLEEQAGQTMEAGKFAAITTLLGAGTQSLNLYNYGSTKSRGSIA